MVQALKAKADQLGVDMRMILTVWSPPGEFKWQSTMSWAGDVNATRGPGPQGDYYPERAIWPDNTAIRGTLNPNKYSEYATWLSQGLDMYKTSDQCIRHQPAERAHVPAIVQLQYLHRPSGTPT
jgi:hypothetical protein